MNSGVTNMLRNTLMLACVLVAGVSFAAGPNPKDAPVEIVSAEFGIFDDSNPGELVFEPTTVVPHRLGQRYGWIIEVRTARRSVAVREEYLMPLRAAVPEDAAPTGDSVTIPLQRRNQVSQRQLVPVAGRIYGEWAVGPGEPAGHRHLQVVVEGQPGISFEYDVK